jgi:hypothetical protein
MEIFEILRKEILGFFSLQGVIDLIASGDYSSLRTWSGITTVLSPLIPLIVVVEMVMAFAHSKLKFSEYKIPFFIYVFNRIAGRYISFGIVAE